MTITASRTSRTHQQYAAIDREFGLALEGLPQDATAEHILGTAVRALVLADVNPNVVHKFTVEAGKHFEARALRRQMMCWQNHYTILANGPYPGVEKL